MEMVNVVLLILLSAELMLLLFNLSKLRDELGERQEKVASELSEIKKLLQK